LLEQRRRDERVADRPPLGAAGASGSKLRWAPNPNCCKILVGNSKRPLSDEWRTAVWRSISAFGHTAALTREDAVAATIRFINPDALTKPPTYTQVVEVTGPGRTVFISGQLATGRDGNLVSSDFRAQAVQVFENLKAALAAVGASFEDVVKVNSYLSDVAHLPILREVRAGYLNATALPASTTLGGQSFAREGALLEVEVVAALPARAARGSAKRVSRKAAAKRTTTRKSAAKARGRKK
jgi:enamine deaminase RidA (YjgF/YER057c/UK114 family)